VSAIGQPPLPRGCAILVDAGLERAASSLWTFAGKKTGGSIDLEQEISQDFADFVNLLFADGVEKR